MDAEKIIIMRKDLPKKKGKVFANIHLLVGYNQATIKDLIEMAAEMHKTFPEATIDRVRGGKVFKSSRYDGFTIVGLDTYITEKAYPGWTVFIEKKAPQKPGKRYVAPVRRPDYFW